ncbi:MAG: hypothetical protein ACK5HL_03270 [Bacilli bacterium]
MNKKIKDLIDSNLVKMELFCDNVSFDTEHGILFLRITLDKKEGYIDLDTVTTASRIINKLIDENDFIEKKFILEIWAKEKGEIL